jgi:hypothetical protein
MKLQKYKLIIVSIILSLLILCYGYCNLRYYAYYYATHMPHEKNEYPIIRELSVRTFPESVNKDYPNDFNRNSKWRGRVQIGETLENGKVWIWELDDTGLTYQPDYYDNYHQIVIYDINRNYCLGKADYEGTPKPSRKDARRAVKILDHLTQRLKNESPRPIINLQWLYNFGAHFRPNPEAD